MKKRILSILMTLILLFTSIPSVYAAEEEDEDFRVGTLELFSDNAPKRERWTAALLNDELIQMQPKDIATIAGAKLSTTEKSYTFNRKGYCVKVNKKTGDADIYVDLGDNQHITLYGGSFQLDKISTTDSGSKKLVYLPLEQMLYLLNVQWICIENCVYTIAPKDTIWSLTSEFMDIYSNLPTRIALAGEDLWEQYGSYFKYATLAYVDDIDPLFWVPGIGVTEKNMEEALLTLGQPFTGSTPQAQKNFQSYFNTFLPDTAEVLTVLSSKLDGTLSAVETASMFMSDLSDVLPAGLDEFKTGATAAFALLDLNSGLQQAILTANRYTDWSTTYLDQLSYLSDIKTSTDNDYVKLLTGQAQNLYSEYNSFAATLGKESAATTFKTIANTVVGLTLYGQVTGVYNLILSGLKTIPAFAKSLQAGDAYVTSMELYDLTTFMNPRFKKAATIAQTSPQRGIADMRLTCSILLGSAAHCWDKLASAGQSTNTPTDVAVSSKHAGYYAALLARLNESSVFDETLQINKNFTDLYCNASGARREKIPPEYVSFTVPVLYASCIGEYDGTVYCTNEVPGSGFELLPATAPNGYYVSRFAFFNDALYYYCKEPGTWDYDSRLYRSNPDGSDPVLLKDFGVGGSSNSFHISEDGMLYPWDGSEYYNTNTGKFVETYDEIGFFPGALPWFYNSQYCVMWDADGDYIIAPYTRNKKNALVYGDSTTILRGTVMFSNLINITSDAFYYQLDRDNLASLYRYDIESGKTEVLDSRPSAGSGGYFSW